MIILLIYQSGTSVDKEREWKDSTNCFDQCKIYPNAGGPATYWRTTASEPSMVYVEMHWHSSETASIEGSELPSVLDPKSTKP